MNGPPLLCFWAQRVKRDAALCLVSFRMSCEPERVRWGLGLPVVCPLVLLFLDRETAPSAVSFRDKSPSVRGALV